MKTPLGTEVDLGQSLIVLDGAPALLKRDTAAPPPLFGPSIVVTVTYVRLSATAEFLLLYHLQLFSRAKTVLVSIPISNLPFKLLSPMNKFAEVVVRPNC